MARTSAVIDADGHILERQIDAQKYLEPPFDKRKTRFFQDSHPWDTEIFGTLTNTEYKDAGLSPEEQVATWLKIADRENFETAGLFPTGSGHVAYIPEPDWAVAVSRAINTHLAKDYGGTSERLRPVGVLPMRNPEAAAQELRRAVTEENLVPPDQMLRQLPQPAKCLRCELVMRAAVGEAHFFRRLFDQPAVVIAGDTGRRVQPGQQGRRTGRIQWAAEMIAQIDDIRDARSLDIGDHRLQRETVPVNVGNDGKTHGGAPVRVYSAAIVVGVVSVVGATSRLGLTPNRRL